VKVIWGARAAGFLISRLPPWLRFSLELLAIGQQVQALDVLSGLLLGSKYPINFAVTNSSAATQAADYIPGTDLERIVLKVVDLGVALRYGRLVKEVLLHSRGALQAVHPLCFEVIIRKFIECTLAQLSKAEAKFAEVESTRLAADLHAIDLDEEASASAATLSSSTEERELVTPWLRFYWEVLRVALDLSRNNSRLEQCYADVVKAAFSFCSQYQRRSEFRRLCEMVRYHLSLTLKYPNQTNAVPLLTSAESHQLAMDIRFAQLALATDLELWQEAFRTIEDIHGLLALVRKTPRQVLQAGTYYEQLARIFSKSDNMLFLAATLMRLVASKKGAVPADLALTTVMATLAVPLGGAEHVEDEKMGRLIQILGLSSAPTRANLLLEIAKEGLVKAAGNEALSELYALLSADSLSDCARVVAVLKAIRSGETERFVAPCYENGLLRVIQGRCRGFDEVSLGDLRALASEDAVRAAGLVRKFNLELWLMLQQKQGADCFGGARLRLDHQRGVLLIDRSVVLSAPVPFSGAVRQSASEIWSQLYIEASKLLGSAEPVLARPSFAVLKGLLAREHAANLERRTLIEKRKEAIEAALLEKERAEARERALRQSREAEQERLRLAEEAARRDRERLERERAEIRKIEAEKRLAEQEKLKEAAGQRLNRERLVTLATRLDHLERAQRQEELPLLQAAKTEQAELDLRSWKERQESIVAGLRARHERDLEAARRIVATAGTLEADRNVFLERIRAQRMEVYEQRLVEAQAALEADKAARLVRHRAQMEAVERSRADAAARVMTASAELANEGGAAASGRYVPPSKAAAMGLESLTGGVSAWRRSAAPAAATELPMKTEPVPVNANANANANATAEMEAPKKDVYVPRHKRTSAAN
jgi:translation initiation factor 3 subunit A